MVRPGIMEFDLTGGFDLMAEGAERLIGAAMSEGAETDSEIHDVLAESLAAIVHDLAISRTGPTAEHLIGMGSIAAVLLSAAAAEMEDDTSN